MKQRFQVAYYVVRYYSIRAEPPRNNTSPSLVSWSTLAVFHSQLFCPLPSFSSTWPATPGPGTIAICTHPRTLFLRVSGTHNLYLLSRLGPVPSTTNPLSLISSSPLRTSFPISSNSSSSSSRRRRRFLHLLRSSRLNSPVLAQRTRRRHGLLRKMRKRSTTSCSKPGIASTKASYQVMWRHRSWVRAV